MKTLLLAPPKWTAVLLKFITGGLWQIFQTSGQNISLISHRFTLNSLQIRSRQVSEWAREHAAVIKVKNPVCFVVQTHIVNTCCLCIQSIHRTYPEKIPWMSKTQDRDMRSQCRADRHNVWTGWRWIKQKGARQSSNASIPLKKTNLPSLFSYTASILGGRPLQNTLMSMGYPGITELSLTRQNQWSWKRHRREHC